MTRKPRRAAASFARKEMFHCEGCQRVIRYLADRFVMRYNVATDTIRTPSGLTINLRRKQP